MVLTHLKSKNSLTASPLQSISWFQFSNCHGDGRNEDTLPKLEVSGRLVLLFGKQACGPCCICAHRHLVVIVQNLDAEWQRGSGYHGQNKGSTNVSIHNSNSRSYDFNGLGYTKFSIYDYVSLSFIFFSPGFSC